MSQVLAAFGIDWHLLLINAINFALLLLALWYFLYAPLTKMLRERRQMVAQGVRDAESAQQKLHEVERSRGEILAKAGHEADEVLSKARAAAEAKAAEVAVQSETRAAAALVEAEAQAQELKAQALAESKQEVAKLVVLGMERIFNEHSTQQVP
jgi:F-type H+-transporting ATPase subunit b